MLAGVLLAAPAAAGPRMAPRAPSFTGRWVAELDTQSGLSTDAYLLKDGIYSCTSCSPERHYPADGKLHPIAGDPDRASESVTITSPRSIVTRIEEPAIRRSTTMTVSRDGAIATCTSIDHRPGIAKALKTVYVARRIAPAPPGAHAISGKWKGMRYVSVPELSTMAAGSAITCGPASTTRLLKTARRFRSRDPSRRRSWRRSTAPTPARWSRPEPGTARS
jgi:hypothetical protein